MNPDGRGRRRRWAPAALALGLACAGFWPRPAVPQSSSEPAPAASVESRTADCPTCAAMAARLPAGEFDHDPHTFACRTCHHPHTQKTPDAWRQRCTTPDCHPRPWPRTVFHRVEPEVFLNCLNCHRPHTWTLNGQNCLGCHAAQLDTLRVGPDKVVGMKGTFSHAIHKKVECKQCHDSTRKHAVTLIKTADDCQACHHGPPAVAPCSTCHTGKMVPAPRNVEVTLAFSVWPKPRKRTLPFAHERHASLECGTCHKGSAKPNPETLCASCHKQHRAEAQCMTCHRPPAATAHTDAVHDKGCTGSGCHQDPPFPKVVQVRNFCLVCHQDRVDHNQGENCVDCH